jgi:succinate dehydrogenase/fumarate reductase flavoprotein subunit
LCGLVLFPRLIKNFNLDLSLVSRLGGHTQPRTHRGGERFPGMTITYGLLEKYEEIVKKEPQRAALVVDAQATKLITNNKGEVIGVEYLDLKTNQNHSEYGPVVLATGGFGADFSENSILKQVRPDLMHLPTTNGDHW